MKWRSLGSPRIGWLVWLAYFAWFLLLFSQLPLQGRISGNTDLWLGIAMAHALPAELAGGLSSIFGADVQVARSMFPSTRPPHAYGESSLVSASVYLALHGLTRDIPAALWLHHAFVFSGTAFGVYLLARRLRILESGAIFAGFAFGVSNILFASLDDSLLVTFFFLPSCLAWCGLLDLAEKGGRPRDAMRVSLWCAVQLWVSVYSFVFLVATLVILVPLMALREVGFRRTLIDAGSLLGLAAGIVLMLPWFVFYLATLRSQTFVELWDVTAMIRGMSVAPTDLLRALPGNLVLGHTSEGIAHPGARQKHLWGGAFLALTALWALVRWRSFYCLVPLLLIAVGIVLAFAAPFQLFGREWFPPMAWLVREVEFVRFLRWPVRGWFLVLLGGSLLAGWTVEGLVQVVRRRWGGSAAVSLLAVALAVHAVENIPFPISSWSVDGLDARGADWVAALRSADAPTSADAVLHLPADLPLWIGDEEECADAERCRGPGSVEVRDEGLLRNAGDDLYPYNREFIYMYWQTLHGRPVVNGLHGYVPHTRIEMQRWIQRLPEQQAIEHLRKEGVRWVVLHPQLAVDSQSAVRPRVRGSGERGATRSERSRLEAIRGALEQDRYARRVHADDQAVVFELVAP